MPRGMPLVYIPASLKTSSTIVPSMQCPLLSFSVRSRLVNLLTVVRLVSWVSAHGRFNKARDFGLHGRLSGIYIAYVYNII